MKESADPTTQPHAPNPQPQQGACAASQFICVAVGGSSKQESQQPEQRSGASIIPASSQVVSLHLF